MAGRGAEKEESKPIYGIDLGTWLQKKLENLSAAPDELDHASRENETSPPIFVIRVTYFCPSWKRPSPCFQYVPATVVVLSRQTSQNIHTFCRRFRSRCVFGRAPLLVGETAEVVLPSATNTEFDSI